MQTIRIKKIIHAPIEQVFDAYTDHAALARVPGVRSARVTKPGIVEPNGLGAVREVDGRVVWLREEITAFERPRLMEYRIREARPKADHRLGRVEFAEVAGGTEITWTTIFDVRIPVVGRLVAPAARISFALVFRLVLRDVEQRAMAATRAQR